MVKLEVVGVSRWGAIVRIEVIVMFVSKTSDGRVHDGGVVREHALFIVHVGVATVAAGVLGVVNLLPVVPVHHMDQRRVRVHIAMIARDIPIPQVARTHLEIHHVHQLLGLTGVL